jgi:ketosteroid isomerase-like protein
LKSESENEVIRILDAYKEAVYRKDISAYVALYADKAQIFDMWGLHGSTKIETLGSKQPGVGSTALGTNG